MSTSRIANRVARRVWAVKRFELLGKTNREMRDNARGVDPKFVRRDGMTFSFKAGSKGYEVQARISGEDLDTADVELSCTCPAWQYLGPEYHAKAEGYLLGRPRGTASKPEVRDPKGTNRLCKHSVAVLRRLERYLDK